MTLTLANAIQFESFFKVTVGIGGKITSEQLTLLQTGVTEAVLNFIGNRALPEDLKTRITALFILDLYQNSPGKGTIVKESVTDNSWQANINSSSAWMDRAIGLRDEFDSSKVAKDISTDPVIRVDSHIDGIIDDVPYPPDEWDIKYSNMRVG